MIDFNLRYLFCVRAKRICAWHHSYKEFEKNDASVYYAVHDGIRIQDAPYTESVWFHTTNDTGPVNHMHEDLDEFIAFIGGNPEHPEELNGDISLVIGDEIIHTTKSTIVYIPRRVPHGLLLVHELKKDILHFSGGNGSNYRKDSV